MFDLVKCGFLIESTDEHDIFEYRKDNQDMYDDAIALEKAGFVRVVSHHGKSNIIKVLNMEGE